MTVLRRSQLALRRAYGTTTKKQSNTKLTVGIRREDPLRIWERRCPLTPDAVHELVHKDGVEVLVQPCERRVFTANDFLKVCALCHIIATPHNVWRDRLVPTCTRPYNPRMLSLASRRHPFPRSSPTPSPLLDTLAMTQTRLWCLGPRSCSRTPSRASSTTWNCCRSSSRPRTPAHRKAARCCPDLSTTRC